MERPPPTNPKAERWLDCRYYCASLLDIQGSGQRLCDLELAWKADPKSQNTKKLLTEQGALIAQVRATLAGQAEADRPTPLPVETPADFDHAAYEAATSAEYYTWSFSDTALLYGPVSDAEGQTLRPRVIHGVLAGTALTTLLWLAAGVPLRGAVALRLGMRMPTDELYGPVLHTLYKLESAQAKWPRVLIDPELVAFLQNKAQMKSDAVSDILTSEAARACMGMLVRSPDKVTWMLDILSPTIIGEEPTGDMKSVVERVRDFVRRSLAENANGVNPTLHERYLELDRYVASRLLRR
jgi:hypothetical protein